MMFVGWVKPIVQPDVFSVTNATIVRNTDYSVRIAHAQTRVKGTLEAKQNGAQCAPLCDL